MSAGIGSDSGDSVSAMLAAVARERPDQVAVESNTGVLTWREVERAVALLADRLRSAGTTPGNVVAVSGRRSPHLLVAMLACWRVGCAFTVLDTSWPAPRLRDMIHVAGCRVRCDGMTVTRLDPTRGGTAPTPAEPAPATVSAQAAYVLFTSGSSGRPKGAVVGHAALANTIGGVVGWLRARRDEPRGVCLAPAYYDAAIFEIFTTLAAGGRLYIADERERVDPGFVAAGLRSADVEWLTATPGWLRLLALADPGALDGALVVSEGEALSPRTAQQLTTAGAELWNAYGPTETAICATMHRVSDVDPGATIPIGRPIPGVTISVVGPDLRDLSPGEPGEIVIGGRGVGLGYLADPDRQLRAFVYLPDGGRAYRTGDLGSVGTDGVVSYHGRADGQVKVNGHRIELADIEANARRCPGVSDAVTMRGGPAGHGRLEMLVAGTATRDEVDEFMKNRLPAHLRPAVVVVVAELPLTGRGKVDRARAQQIVAESLRS